MVRPRWRYPRQAVPGWLSSGEHGPVVRLAGGRVELRDMAAFAGERAHVPVGVGQPVVRGLLVVARFAAAHGVIQGRVEIALGALSLREVVYGAVKILAHVDPARIKLDVIRAILLGFLEVNRVVQRIVAVGTFDHALGVDIPRARRATLCPRSSGRFRRAPAARRPARW